MGTIYTPSGAGDPLNRPSLPRHTILLVVGSLLTVASGLLMWSLAQRAAWRGEASRVLQEVSRQMDGRHYKMRQVIWAVEQGARWDRRVELWKVYRDGALIEWNENLNRNRMVVCEYFGREASREFEHVIAARFRRLHNGLIPFVTKPPPANERIRAARVLADSLEADIRRLSTTLGNQVRSANLLAWRSSDRC